MMPCPTHDSASAMLAFFGVESALLARIVPDDLGPLPADAFKKGRAPVLVRAGLLSGLQPKSSQRGAR